MLNVCTMVGAWLAYGGVNRLYLVCLNVIGKRCFPTGNKHPLSLDWDSVMMLCLINGPVRCCTSVAPRCQRCRALMPPQIPPAAHCQFSWNGTQASPFRMFMDWSHNLNCMSESWFHSLPSSFLFLFHSNFLSLSLPAPAAVWGNISFVSFILCSVRASQYITW